MSRDSRLEVDRRDVLKATGGLAGGATLASGRSVAALGSEHSESLEQCFDDCRPITREERRLFIAVNDEDEESEEGEDTPVAQRLLEASGFDEYVTAFMEDLCQTGSRDEAVGVVEEHGKALWDAALERAQSDQSDSGEGLHRYDSRPLYWARLKMAAAIRQWDPDFRVEMEGKGDLHASPQQLEPDYDSPDEVREGLVHALQYTSRGLTSTTFPDDSSITRVIVSGFDTFGLDDELRNVNPSAVSVLQLDGRTFDTEGGKVHVEGVIFPVRWEDFDQGIVEDSFGPHLTENSDECQADLLMTISQGGPSNPEQWAAAWREGARYGNNLETREGYIPPAPGWTQPDERIDWIETTLPVEAMEAVEVGPTEVELDPSAVGWENPSECPDPRLVPVIENRLVEREGSVDGMLPFAGGGGNYLSNESMYRSNRLRIALGLEEFPGGHLHIDGPDFAEDNAIQITDSQFEEQMKAIADQTVAIVRAAGAAVGQG